MIFPNLPSMLSIPRPSESSSSSSPSSAATSSTVSGTGIVGFADYYLESAIRDAIGKPFETIQSSDLEGLQSLGVSGRRITTLDGIERCVNLVSIDLSDNDIVDFAPLAALGKLEQLNLSRTGLRESASLELIVQCTNLRTLNLSGNEIVDITPLADLWNLSELDLSSNLVTDATPLLENPGLGDGDRIDLRFNPMDVGEESTNRAAIRTLEVRGVHVSPSGDDSIIAFPDSGLESAIRNAIGQKSGHLIAESLQGVFELEAASCSINDLEGMQYLEAVQRINLSWNEIADCRALTDLPHVYELKLQGNKIRNITSVVGMNGLSSLYLSANGITDIDVDWQSRGLLVLSLDRNEIENIEAIAELKGLRSFDASENRIADISALRGFQFLDHLALNKNQIIDISVLSGLNALREIELADNQIVDISPLMSCLGLRGEGAYVDLRDNPLDTSDDSVTMSQIAKLRARGVNVKY